MRKWVNKVLSFTVLINMVLSAGIPIYSHAESLTTEDELSEDSTIDVLEDDIDLDSNDSIIYEEDTSEGKSEQIIREDDFNTEENETIHNEEELSKEIKDNEEDSRKEIKDSENDSNDESQKYVGELEEDLSDNENKESIIDIKQDEELDNNIEDEEIIDETDINTFNLELSSSDIIANSKLKYQTHVQSIGWQNWVSSGKPAGTTGEGLRVEAINLKIDHSDLGIRYRTNVQGSDSWTGWSKDGETSGTTGQQKHIEAVQIELTGKEAANYDIYYRVHSRAFGWLGWAKNGQPSGSKGYNYRIESLEVQLIKKGDKAPSQNGLSFQEISAPNLRYEAHIQKYGWMGNVNDGQVAGVNSESLRLEAFRATVNHPGLNIRYRSKTLDNKEWSTWSNNGETSGTIGQALPIESIQMELYGDMARHFDIYYRVKAENLGWLGWARRGETAGTEWYDYQLEAFEIRIVPRMNHSMTQNKSSFESNPTPILEISTHVQSLGWLDNVKSGEIAGTMGKALRTEGFTIDLKNLNMSGGIEYRAHVEKDGWQSWRRNGQVAGTEGQRKRVEAIEVRLYGEIAKHYDIYYSSHIESYGWLSNVKNGMPSGSQSLAKRLEAFKLILLPKSNPIKVNAREGFKRPPIVYLDAGHGGYDPGARHRDATEASLNLSVTLKIERLLKQRGYDVRMSRTKDTALELHERSRDANAQKTDILVSVHHNAMGRPNSNARGIETFIYHRVASGFGQETDRNKFRTEDPRIAESLKLADYVHNQLIRQTGLYNRGVKGNNFHMVREPKMTAILLELGFIDNDAELAIIRTDSFQNAAAKAVADGIDEYFGNWR